jgi:hypothetical protein
MKCVVESKELKDSDFQDTAAHFSSRQFADDHTNSTGRAASSRVITWCLKCRNCDTSHRFVTLV